MMKPQFREQWDDDADALARALSDHTPIGESMTQQHHQPDTDLNVVLKRYGIDDHPMPLPGNIVDFGDFTEHPTTLHEALERTRNAQNRFAQLPAHIRSKFNNNPAELWNWLQNDANLDEAVSLGLLQQAPDPAAPKLDANTQP